MEQIAILGAGIAGFGAAHRLCAEGASAVIYEKKPYYGGHTASYKYEEGFIFDDGPHVSFTKDGRIQELFAESVNQEYEIIQTRVNNYWKGYWIKHPAQCNLHGLPDDLVVKVLKDFIDARNREPGKIRNYADWLVATYGKTFAETFPMEYGLKYHTTTADNMTTEWLGDRLYRPDLEEVLRGALSQSTPDVHYVSHFRYPTYNGFVSYLNLFVKESTVELGHELKCLDPREKTLRFKNGSTINYSEVISSIPLPQLIPLIAGVPQDVLEAAQDLACSQSVIVNIGIDRSDVSSAHWTYFYDRDIFFTRLSFPHMLSPNTVPSGAGSIQAEVYYSDKYRPLDRNPGDCVEPVIADLRRCGLIKDDDEILFKNATIAPFANVIFDLDRDKNLAIAHGYLDEIGVFYCGRYGEWGYHWTDESFVSGEMAAQKALDARGASAHHPSISAPSEIPVVS